jgi:predicted  nucleic acid-binding Zn-ribbon protein
MRNIRFKEILFLSYREKKAKRINLDSDVVVVKGGNGTGKSCLLKSLYGVFGAHVNKYPEGWDPHFIVVLLKFQIDGVTHRALRIGRDYYLLNPDNTAISETISMDEQAKSLSMLFGFDLYYYSDQSQKKRLPVGCYFMPFYIDQDSGWQQPWSSFTQVGNEQVKRNVMLYYTGVVNYDYYLSKSHLQSLQNEHRRWKNERTIQNNFISIIRDKLKSNSTMSLTEDAFKEEIETFVIRIQDLKERQNKILKELEELYYDKLFKESRVASLHANIKAIEEDFNYAIQHEDMLICPVCGAQTENTALARYGMNVDKEESRELIMKYKMELDEIKKKIERANKKSDELKKQIEEIEALITTKKEEYTLKEYLDNKVIEKLQSIFYENEQEFENNIERLEEEIKGEEDKLKSLKGTSRLKVILDDFNACLRVYSKELGSAFDESKPHGLGEKIKGSGSSHPKETLAYFFSYLTIMHKYSTPIMLPIVIDEFKQNGSTDQSVDKMIGFAISHRPKNGQVIYSVSDEYTASCDNVMTVSLDGDTLMNENDYISVRNEIDDILNKNFKLR